MKTLATDAHSVLRNGNKLRDIEMRLPFVQNAKELEHLHEQKSLYQIQRDEALARLNQLSVDTISFTQHRMKTLMHYLDLLEDTIKKHMHASDANTTNAFLAYSIAWGNLESIVYGTCYSLPEVGLADQLRRSPVDLKPMQARVASLKAKVHSLPSSAVFADLMDVIS